MIQFTMFWVFVIKLIEIALMLWYSGSGLKQSAGMIWGSLLGLVLLYLFSIVVAIYCSGRSLDFVIIIIFVFLESMFQYQVVPFKIGITI